MSVTDVLAIPQIPPARWGARVDYDTWDRKTDTTQLFIHWGGSRVAAAAADGDVAAEMAQLRSWERHHIDNRGWRGLAYDWAVGNSGVLYRIRGLSRSAATSGDADADGYSNNAEGEALVFIIGSGQTPTNAALATAGMVVDALGYRQMYGHKEAKGTVTECPGPDLMRWLDGLRNPTKEHDMGSLIGLALDSKPSELGRYLQLTIKDIDSKYLPKWGVDSKPGGETATAITAITGITVKADDVLNAQVCALLRRAYVRAIAGASTGIPDHRHTATARVDVAVGRPTAV